MLQKQFFFHQVYTALHSILFKSGKMENQLVGILESP